MVKATNRSILFFIAALMFLAFVLAGAGAENADTESSFLMLNADTLEIARGKTMKVTAQYDRSVHGAASMTWYASNPEIASVENGNIRGLAEGWTPVSCMAEFRDGTVLTAYCEVYVYEPVVSMKAEQGKVNLLVGQRFQPKVLVTPENATYRYVTWVSSDETILSVNSYGLVSALSPGKAVLTGSITEPGAVKPKTVKIQVTVTQPVTDLEITEQSTCVPMGKTRQLTVNIQPEKAGIEWSSSDESIATVSNGVVKGKATGSCIITAKARDGSGFSDSCKITVVRGIQSIAPESILHSVKPVSEYTVFIGKPRTLTVSIKPEDATVQSLLWESSDPEVAEVDSNGKVYGIKPGKCIITARTQDGSNLSVTMACLIEPGKEEEADTAIHQYEYHLADCGWKEANRRTNNLGGQLVNIDSEAEYEEILSEIQALGLTDTTFWIGLTRNSDHTTSPELFYRTDRHGGTSDNPVDFDTLLDGINPWAVGEPCFRNEDDTSNAYVCMRYSEDEKRWVWVNTPGEPEAGRKTGYIIEYSKPSTLAGVPEGGEPSLPDVILDEQEESAPAEDRKFEILKCIYQKDRVLLKINAPERCCVSTCLYTSELFKSDAYYPLGAGQNDWIRATNGAQWVTIELREKYYYSWYENVRAEYLLTPEGKKIRQEGTYRIIAYLYSVDQETQQYKDQLTEKFYSVGCVYPGVRLSKSIKAAEETETSPEDPELLYRFMPVIASDPIRREDGRKAVILDAATGETVAETVIGEAVYLPEGSYILRTESDETVRDARLRYALASTKPGVTFRSDSKREIIDNPFRMRRQPQVFTVTDWKTSSLEGRITKNGTSDPVSGATVTVTAQGRRYQTTTDENGRYAFSGLPPVLAEVTVESEEDIVNPTQVFLRPGKVTCNLSTESGVPSAFFGYLFDGAADWYEEYHKWAAGLPENRDEMLWFLGRGWYFQVTESIYGAGSPGEVYNIGENERVAQDHAHYPEQTRAEVDAEREFEMYGDMSELVVIEGTVMPDRLKELNSHFDYVFGGWSSQTIPFLEVSEVETPKQAYYHRLLRDIEAEKNPLEDPVTHGILKKQYLDSGMTETQADSVLDVLEKTSAAKYRNLYLLSLFNYDIRAGLISETDENGEKKVSQYDPVADQLLMRNDDPSFDSYISTFFHESGHALDLSDYGTGENGVKSTDHSPFLDEELDVYEGLRKDVEGRIREYIQLNAGIWTLNDREINRIVNAFMYTTDIGTPEEYQAFTSQFKGDYPHLWDIYESVRLQLETNILALEMQGFSNGDMVSDLYGAMTGNRIAGHNDLDTDRSGLTYNNKKQKIERGHEATYWSVNDTVEGRSVEWRAIWEAWAEYFSAEISDDQLHITNNRAYFPEGTKALDAMTDAIYKHYLEKYTKLYGK